MSYEQPLDEYRLLQRPVTQSNGILGPGGYSKTVGYHVTLQRKWLVQNGERYRATESRGDAIQTAGWHPLEPDIGFQWTPVKSEWRDCESVLGKEIRL